MRCIKTPSYSKELEVLESAEYLLKSRNLIYERGKGEHALIVAEPPEQYGRQPYEDYTKSIKDIKDYFHELKVEMGYHCYKISPRSIQTK